MLLSVRMHTQSGNTTPTDSRSQRIRASRKGGQLLTRARSSSFDIGLPVPRVPAPLSRMVAPYTPTAYLQGAGRSRHLFHTRYQRHRIDFRHRQVAHPQDQRIRQPRGRPDSPSPTSCSMQPRRAGGASTLPTWSHSFALGRPSWTDSSSSAKTSATPRDHHRPIHNICKFLLPEAPDSVAVFIVLSDGGATCHRLIVWFVAMLIQRSGRNLDVSRLSR